MPPMNFFLQQIERHIDESLLIQGEDILAKDGILSLEEIESHLWAFKVIEEGDAKFEVEIQITPSKIKAFTCDCDIFKAQKNCPHIVASLLALRRRKNEEKKAKRTAKQSAKPSKKLSIQQVLDQLSKEELIEVIKDFTRQNRTFALSLKARYAYKVPSVDSQKAYLQLMNAVLQMARRPDRSFNKRGAGNIAKIMEEMVGQMQIHLLQQHYAEVFALGQSILIKIPPILGKILSEEEILQAPLENTFKVLGQLIEAPIPPALKDRIWDFCLEEVQKIAYRNHQLDHLFHPLLIKLIEDDQQQDLLLEISSRILDQYRQEEKALPQALYFHYSVWERKYGKKMIQQYIAHSVEGEAELEVLINYVIKQQDYKKAEQFARTAIKLAKSAAEKVIYKTQLLRLAELQKNRTKSIKLAEELFLQSKEIRYFRKIKQAAAEEWPEVLQKLLLKLKKLEDNPKLNALLPQIFGEEQLIEQLLDFIKRYPSIDLLLNFDKFLLPDYQKELQPIYVAEVQNYLNAHLGRITSTKIRAIIQHLHRLGAHRIGNELVQIIRKDYAERPSLMEELSLF